jgi:hypothetical protein
LWEPCNFTDYRAPVQLENIITETSFTSQKFLLYGDTVNANGKTVGVLVRRQRVCACVQYVFVDGNRVV